MRFLLGCAAVLSVTSCVCADAALRGTAAAPTVPALNITQYLGRWYQVVQERFDNATFQPNPYCATAGMCAAVSVP